MIASSENPSSPAERPWFPLVASAVAVVAFLGMWSVVQHGRYKRGEITDLPVYERYGDSVYSHHLVPYRDFALEYPPAALPMFVLPSIGHSGNPTAYERVFTALMWVCGAAMLVCIGIVFSAVRAPPLRVVAALALVVVAPLLLGSVIRLRFDLWPAALTAAAVAATVSGRRVLAGASLGLAVAAKLYPIVLLPLVLLYFRRRGGLYATASAFVATVAVCFLPFVALAPGGVFHSITRQLSRPLQIESLGASLLLVAHQLLGTKLTMVTSHGSQNLAGGTARTLAAASTAAGALALVALWIAYARGPCSSERFLRYAAAAVCAFIAFGKVFSPQFMIWLIPLVPLVRGRRGLAASALLTALLVLTQLWFPNHYWRLILQFRARESWLVFVRDLGVVALLGLLVYGTRTRTDSQAVARPS